MTSALARPLSPARPGQPPGEPLDARLAIGAVGAWLALLACLGRSADLVAVIAVVAAVGGLVLLWLSARGVAVTGAGALLLFCITLVLLPLAGRLALARASPLAALAEQHARVSIELTVRGDPRLLAARGVAGAPRAAVDTRADALLGTGRPRTARGSVLVLGPAALWRDVLPGQRVRLTGTLQPGLQRGSAVTLFAESAPQLIGRPPWWQRAAGAVRSSLRAASAGLPEQARGLLPGLVDGDTTELDPVLAEHFRLAGLTHLTAVSGTNCSILIGAVLLALRRLRVRPWICALSGGMVLVAFVVVARPSPSVLRAALMAAVALVALAVGRPRQALPALSLAVLGVLLWQPTLAANPGFAMSALATAALLVIAPGWAAALRRRRVPAVLGEAVAVAAAAHLVTAPVIAAISGRVSLVAIPANILAEPVVAPATVLGFLAAVIAPWWLGAGRLLAELAGWPCRWLVHVANYFGGLPGATLPWPGGVTGGLVLAAVAIVLLLVARRAGTRRVLVAAALVAGAVQIPVRSLAAGWPPAGWLFVACDVGQGDALVLPAGPHTAVEVDAGPDPVAIDRCLHDLGVTDVALLVFSHYHLDHVGGIAGVLHGRTVGQIITGPLAEPVSGVELVRDALAHAGRHLTITTPAVGQVIDVGRVHLEVLGPAAAFHGTRSDPNNSSLVLRATVGGVRILLPGDAEIEAQQALLDAGTDLRADVLKVPHHGSAYSYPPFLAAVHATLGVISVGLHNDYGHPSPVLLSELARLGVTVRRTDRDGDVAVVGTASGLSAVVRGTRSSTVGMAAGPARTGGRVELASSAFGARMGACPLDPSASTTCPPHSLRSWCSSATRNCSWAVPSARSPPQSGHGIPMPSRPNEPAGNWTAPSCTS